MLLTRKLVLGAMAILTGSAAADVPFRVLVKSGDPRPSPTPGSTFTFLFAPSIGNDGTIAFLSQAGGYGIYAVNKSGGIVSKIAHTGDPAIGAPEGSTFAIPDSWPRVNAAGEVLMVNSFSKPDQTGGPGVWSTAGGTLHNLAYLDEPTPAPAAESFLAFGSSLRSNVLDDTGRWVGAVSVSLPGGASSSAIYTGYDKPLTPVAYPDAPAPAVEAGALFHLVTNPVVNSTGTIAFYAAIKNTTVVGSGNIIYYGQPNALSVLARSKNDAPGASGTFFAFNDPVIADGGIAAFRASLSGGVAAADRGIWKGTPGNLSLVALEGQTTPIADITFSEFHEPVVNSAGQVAFNAELTGVGVSGNNNAGLFTGAAPDQLTLVARDGADAPGIAGVRFSITTAFVPFLNNKGQIAFTAGLTGTGVNLNNDTSLWAYDSAAGLRLVLREGTQFQVAPGVTRAVTDLTDALAGFGQTGAGTGDGRPISLNDNGLLAFAISFLGPGFWDAIAVADINAGGDINAIVGDADHNSIVNHEDFNLLMANFGAPGTFEQGDFNRDGVVNFTDFQILERNFGMAIAGAQPTAATSVPDPSGIAPALAAALLLLRRRRAC